MKKQTVSKLKKKADVLFSKLVRQKNRCEAKWQGGMKCSSQLQCCHIFSRSRNNTRYDLNNAICACSSHHIFWMHKNPIEFTNWLRRRIGSDKLEELEQKSRVFKQWTVDELENLIKAMQGMLKG